jgi:DNA ligase-1
MTDLKDGESVTMQGSGRTPCRSPTLPKVKSFLDAVAQVIGHQPGIGRHRGRLGALLVEFAGGVHFAVGTGLSDRERDKPPPIGSTITFRYQELTHSRRRLK